MDKQVKILAIESSCDETATAVIAGDGANPPSVLSNVVSSQADLHAKTGGVVPEVASRAHVEAIVPVIDEALLAIKQVSKKASKHLNNNTDALTSLPAYMLRDEINYIAITTGPGLIGSLLVGFNAAKTLAYSLDKPVVPINHIEGHIYSALAEKCQNPNGKSKNDPLLLATGYWLREFKFPVLALVVSGGHTSLILMRDHGQYELIGQTLDDAAGEAFDKVAQLLDLGYPGGPAISKLACEFRKNDEAQIPDAKQKSEVLNAQKAGQKSSLGIRHLDFDIRGDVVCAKNLVFPRPLINNKTYNFSFSGLKTAVLSEVKKRLAVSGKQLAMSEKAEIAAAFEDAAVDVLVTKTMRAVEKFKPKTVVLAGGVAANSHLRDRLKVESEKLKTNLLVPPLELCGDNAAMIGLAAYYNVLNGKEKRWDEIDVDSNWEIG